MTIPGVGPITATASAALAPPAETFTKGRRVSSRAEASRNSDRSRRWANER
ncbi:hypothetical protein [Devosia sp. Leaf420]|uniref:hypothetical protein n=1 Tax=Devosia sp. Leaf420 TaxID=1736374 RepID=UPI0023782FAA|nr:hypothetical protein [Devosia sp. Leaf420]